MSEKDSEKLKVAFLGGGIHSSVGRAHRIALEMEKRFELAAGCFSRYPDRNKDSARAYGVPADRTYDRSDELIVNEKDKIHAVVILTPTPNHKRDVVQCLGAGIPVICEKAIAASVKEALEIERVMRQRGGFLAVTYNYSGYPMLRELRSFILEGRLGRVTQIHIEMPQEGFIRADKDGHPIKPQAWRLHDGALPTLSLDLGVHVHHTVDFLTGEKPIELAAVHNRFGSFKQVVDNVMCIARYTHEVVCHIWYSKAALGHRNGLRIRVYGKKGSAEWYQMDPETLHMNDRFGNPIKMDRASKDAAISSEARYNRFKAGHPTGYIEAFANLYWDIADSLLWYLKTKEFKTDEYVFGVEKAMEGLVFLEAVKKSAVKHRWIRLDE